MHLDAMAINSSLEAQRTTTKCLSRIVSSCFGQRKELKIPLTNPQIRKLGMRKYKMLTTQQMQLRE